MERFKHGCLVSKGHRETCRWSSPALKRSCQFDHTHSFQHIAGGVQARFQAIVVPIANVQKGEDILFSR